MYEGGRSCDRIVSKLTHNAPLCSSHFHLLLFFFYFSKTKQVQSHEKMGADANTKQTICTKTAALLDTEMLQKEDSTIPIAKAVELINKFGESHHTHEEALQKCREVGSQIPVIMNSEIGTDPDYKFSFVWFNTIGFVVLHIIGISGWLAALLGYCRVYTFLYCE
jgi:hypothetical protein